MKIIQKTLTVSALLLAYSVASAATEDQREVRNQMARFWGVAEQRVLDAPLPALQEGANDDHQYGSCSGSYGWPTVTHHCTPTRVVRERRPTVQARQQASSSSQKGGVGLTLFGGLRIFDFTWSDENSASNDDLQGNL